MKKSYLPIMLSIDKFAVKSVLSASGDGVFENGANFSNDIEFTE